MNLPALDAPLPASLDAETAVLGSLLLNNACLGRVSPLISAEDFSVRSHGILYGALAELIAEGEGDLLTLKNRLTKAETKEVGGPAYISSLIDGIPDIANVERYAGIVREKARERRLIRACSSAAQDLLYGSRKASDVEETLVELAQAASASHDAVPDDAGKMGAEMSRDSSLRLDERLSNPSAITGIDTGYEALNLHLYGHQRGAVTVVASRSSVGKTLFAWNLMTRALEAGPQVKAAYFSQEMTMKALEERAISMLSGVQSHWLKTGLFIGPRELKKIEGANRKLMEWDRRIYANATPLSIQALGAEAKRLKKTNGLDLLFVDYLQLLGGGEGDNREGEIASISRRLTIMAKQLDCAIIAMSQSNRSGITKDDRATADNMRGSDAIYHDARVLLLLDRPRLRDRDNQEKRYCQLFVHLDKNSEGPLGAIEFHMNGETFQAEEGTCRPGCREYRNGWAPEKAQQGSIDG